MAHQDTTDQAPDIALFAPPKRSRKAKHAGKRNRVSDTPATRPSHEPARANGRLLQPSVTATQHSSSRAHTDAAAKPSEATDASNDYNERREAGVADLSDSATFRDLGVSDWLDRACRSLGMTAPTQVWSSSTSHRLARFAQGRLEVSAANLQPSFERSARHRQQVPCSARCHGR